MLEKSTLLNAIAGVWLVDEGEIIIDGKNVTKLPEHKRAGLSRGRVFHDPANGTGSDYGIEENLALAPRRGRQERFAPVSKEASGEVYKRLLATLGLGLEDRLTSKAGSASW